MEYAVDTTDDALTASGIAQVLAEFGEGAQGTIGEVAALVLCTQLDDETHLPYSEHMVTSFNALCQSIAENLKRQPASKLARQYQAPSLWSFRGDASTMVIAALQVFQPRHAEFLEYWAKRPAEVCRWINAKAVLHGDDATWMVDCKEEIDSGRLIAIQRSASQARSSQSTERELDVLRALVVRMYLAGLKKAGAEPDAVWLQLGYENGIREGIDEVFEKRDAKCPKVDAAKRYVATAMVVVLGEPFVRQNYPAVFARYEREGAGRGRNA